MQFSANNIPERDDMIFVTDDGDHLCSSDARKHVGHMTRRKVRGYVVSGHPETCDYCGKEIIRKDTLVDLTYVH